MKKISDYIFYSSWQLSDADIKPNESFTVTRDIGDLKAGESVVFIGFDDIDNHFGIFVFMNERNEVLEVAGDFSSPRSSSLNDLKNSLLKA